LGKTNFGEQKEFGGALPPNIPPRLRAWFHPHSLGVDHTNLVYISWNQYRCKSIVQKMSTSSEYTIVARSICRNGNLTKHIQVKPCCETEEQQHLPKNAMAKSW